MKKVMTVLACSALALLVACVTADTSDPRVCYLSGCEASIQVSGQRMYQEGGVSCFEASIQNLSRQFDVAVYWTVEFFDKDGRQVARGVSQERKINVRAGDRVSVITQSSDSSAVDFRMKVRS